MESDSSEIFAGVARVRLLAKKLRIGALVTPLLIATANVPNAASAQTTTTQLPPLPIVHPGALLPVPFGVGERLEYEVRFSIIKAGTAVMDLHEITDMRGRPSYHTLFTIKGGIPGYRVNDVYESWFDVATLDSRRYREDKDEGPYEKKRTFEIFPERGMFREDQKEEQVTVSNPLDVASFLYFVRTIPFEVGKAYEVPRYYDPAANPVLIRVVRRDTIKVPAGRFATVVLQPVFRTKSGLFGENNKGEVWIADDSTRIMVQMKSSLNFGSLNLYLKKLKLATPK